MDVFLDTDVIIDYLTDRKPYAEESEKLLALIEHDQITAHASSLCFSNLFFLLRQQVGRSKAISTIRELAGLIHILKVDEGVVTRAIDSEFRDFEDALQYFTALEFGKIDVILTRNIKDYKHSELSVMSPDSFLGAYYSKPT